MTSSFNTVLGSQRDTPPDISKWNYASTEPDLVKSVNSEIDETTKLMNDLRDGLGALYDFLDIKTKRRAYS